jgi:glycosyltransferase involved in cell wall biosynthesis
MAFWHEVDVPVEREKIRVPTGAPSWCVAELGASRSLRMLSDWQPDVIYSHKVEDPELEAATLRIAPSVYFAHDYQGMCISGTKTFKFPVTRPCRRQFSGACLAHYYPHRCGGLSPITMTRLYRLQKKRLNLLRRYDAIVAHSEHMLGELNNHGLAATNVFEPLPEMEGQSCLTNDPRMNECDKKDSDLSGTDLTHWNLLFSGRMELLKGGHVFLDALPKVAAALDKPLHIAFAGDGRLRRSWERQAAHLQERNEKLRIEFVGWVDRPGIDSLLDDCDLMVLPSLWPEPFGLVGPEAGLKGVPVAAFAVGGISDWLEDGTNGYLAPGDPPTADGLAEAILRCLHNPLTHARLRQGARRMAKRFSIKYHLSALLEVFESVAGGKELSDSRFVKPIMRVG